MSDQNNSSINVLLHHDFRVESSDYFHDPLGDEIQMHELDDGTGDVVFSFSDRVIQALDLQPSDIMKFIGEEDNPSSWRLINKSAEDRKQQQENLETWIEP